MRSFLAVMSLLAVVVVFAGGSSTANPKNNVGGQFEIPADDAEAVRLLETSVATLVTGDGKAFELVSISKITKQVVAGHKFTYYGVFKMGSENTECTCSIWHRAWLDDPKEKTKIKIECAGETTYGKGDDGAW